jgi:3-oxocholest-4-en-26-oyl-CoA dehydrogenase alpha subunit
MDFRFPDDVEAFADEVRAFLGEQMAPARTAGHGDAHDLTGLDESFERSLQTAAGERGYLGASVPRDLGGSGRSASHQAVFNLQAAAHGAPLIDTAMTLAGQPILEHGTDGQRAFFLPRMLRGEIGMAIAYTEADAGSDLSAIKATAEADGDDFVLRGTKVMVTGAHKADWCVTVAVTRTDVAARDGMSMFLVDMRATGVRVVRRRTMNGWTLDEVHFDGVRLGPDALLGVRDGGWRQLVSAVRGERSGTAYLGFASDMLDTLIAYVASATRDGVPLVDDPIVRDRLATLWIELDAGLRLAKRALWLHERGETQASIGAMAKVYATELLQRLAQAATEIAGHPGAIWAPLYDSDPYDNDSPGAAAGRFAWEYLERVHGTVSVGANELQRDAIAQVGLGLPRRSR